MWINARSHTEDKVYKRQRQLWTMIFDLYISDRHLLVAMDNSNLTFEFSGRRLPCMHTDCRFCTHPNASVSADCRADCRDVSDKKEYSGFARHESVPGSGLSQSSTIRRRLILERHSQA